MLKLVELVDRKKDEEEINLLSPLTWAYIGDTVYDMFIRTHLINTTKLNPHKMHLEATKYVKAKAQAELLLKISDFLTEKEKDIVRRARNADSKHLPKHAEVQDYKYSTAFEGLIGYLYLTKQDDRLKEIIDEVHRILFK